MARHGKPAMSDWGGQVGLVWLALLAWSCPVIAALLGKEPWGALPSLGLLGCALAVAALVSHGFGGVGRSRR